MAETAETVDTVVGSRHDAVCGADEGASSPPELEPGETIGRHTIRRVLGGGGMGKVYAAVDPQLGREVALKLLRRQATQRRERALLREARALAAVKHPNVVTVHEVGNTADGQLYVSMELIEGQTLGEWLTLAPRPMASVRRVFADAARGLHAAHERGLVHGDFKPDNVMLDGQERVIVLDFGLAHLDGDFDQSDDNSPLMSTSPNVTLVAGQGPVGTVAYMAPELFCADGQSTQRSDQFSFCVALWEALYGAHPFKDADTGDWHLDRPSRPRGRGVPKPLDRALLRGLHRDPGQRLESMQKLIESLDASDERSWVGRQVMGGALLAVCAAVGWSLYQAETEAQARIQHQLACEQEAKVLESMWTDAVRTDAAASFAESGVGYGGAVWEQVDTSLDAWVGRWATHREELCVETEREGQWSESERRGAEDCFVMRQAEFSATLERLVEVDQGVVVGAISLVSRLGDPARCVDRDLVGQQLVPSQPQIREQVLALRMRALEAGVLTKVGRHVEARALAQQVLSEAQALGWAPVEAEAMFALASAMNHAGEHDEAGVLHERVLELAGKSGHDGLAGLAASALVGITLMQAKYELAEHWVRIAEVFLARASLSESVERAVLLTNLGVAYNDQDKHEEAVEVLTRALELWGTAVGSHHPDLGAVYTNFGNAQEGLGDQEAAAKAYFQALESFEAGYGPDHPMTAAGLANIASVYAWRGQHEASFATQYRALEIVEGAYGPNDLRGAKLLNGIGLGLMRVGRYDESFSVLQRSLEIRTAADPTHPRVAATLRSLAKVSRRQGRNDQALELREQSLDRVVSVLGDEHADAIWARIEIGEILLELGQLERAEEELSIALATAREVSPGGSRVTAALSALGRVELGKGNPAAAKVLLAEADLDMCSAARGHELRFARARVVAELGDPDLARDRLETLATELREPAVDEKDPDAYRVLLARVERWVGENL